MDIQVTSIAEAERLMNIDVPKWQASMCWKTGSTGNAFILCVNSASNYLTGTPAYTLKDMMRILPSYIKTTEVMLLKIGFCNNQWKVYYGDDNIACAKAGSLMAALVQACEWLVITGFKLEVNSR